MVDVADFVPGGIKPTDVWKQLVNDGRCSRCAELVSDRDNPLMIFSDDGDALLVYCYRCLEVPASPDARMAGPQPAALAATADRSDELLAPALTSRCPETLGRPEPNAQGVAPSLPIGGDGAASSLRP